MLHPDIRKQSSDIDGSGLFATAFIPGGTVIWQQEPDAQHFTEAEVMQLPPEIRRLCHLYQGVFVLSQGDAEYMNHSCDPNTAHLDDETLIAIRDIFPGDEVTYDYATCEIDPTLWPDWECHCGAPHCRHVVSVRDCLDPAFQARYQGFLPSWTLEYIQKNQTQNRLLSTDFEENPV
ncbi:MAG: SET domain-containing protein [Anaerolineae bacterium]|nr:SET domain-containing protein [Anaerolineae bacterium]